MTDQDPQGLPLAVAVHAASLLASRMAQLVGACKILQHVTHDLAGVP